LNGTLPAYPVLITFDDGFRDNLYTAAPLLQQFGFKATVFIATDYIAQSSTFASREEDQMFSMLTADEIRLLERTGWTVGNHFCSHTNLTGLSLTEVADEYTAAYRTLGDILRDPDSARICAYPRGRHSRHIRDRLRALGARCAFGGGNHAASFNDDLFMIPRIEGTDRKELFKFKSRFLTPFYTHAQYGDIVP